MVVLSSFAPPEEGIVHKQESTQAHIQGRGYIGNGTLYIAESRVSWRGEAGEGFSLEYPAISLHAISRDLNSFPQPCLYLMLDADLQQENHDSSEGSDEEDSPMTEVRFIPENKDALDSVFQAMSFCQSLHPDEDDDSIPEEDPGFEEGNGDYYNTEEGAEHLTADGQQTLERLEVVFSEGNPEAQTGGTGDADMDTDGQADQFADADMDR